MWNNLYAIPVRLLPNGYKQQREECKVNTKYSGIRANLSLLIILGAAVLLLQGCGGGGGGASTPAALTGTLRGVVYAPDGITPVAGAMVYVPVGRAATPEPAVTSTVSANDGSFTLTNVPVGTTSVKIVKNAWTQTINVEIAASETKSLPKETTTFLDLPPDAPVTGDADTLDPPPANPFRTSTQDTYDMPPPPPY